MHCHPERSGVSDEEWKENRSKKLRCHPERREVSKASRTSRKGPRVRRDLNQARQGVLSESSCLRSSLVQRGTNQRHAQLFLRRSTPPQPRHPERSSPPGSPARAIFACWGGKERMRPSASRGTLRSPLRHAHRQAFPRENSMRRFGHTTAALKGRASEVAEKLDVGWKWAGHDLGRAAKSAKMSGALAPEGRLSWAR